MATFTLTAFSPIPSFTVPFSSFDSREAWGDELLAAVQQWQPDLVVLSGLMRLLPPRAGMTASLMRNPAGPGPVVARSPAGCRWRG